MEEKNSIKMKNSAQNGSASGGKKIDVKISGMTCVSCALGVEKKLNKLEGVQSVKVNFVSKEAIVEYDESKLSRERIDKEIRSAGFDVINTNARVELEEADETSDDIKKQKTRIWFVIPVTILAMVLMFWELASQYKNQAPSNLLGKLIHPILLHLPDFMLPMGVFAALSFIVASIFLFWIGLDFVKAVPAFFLKRRANMNTLVGFGTLTAYVYSAAILLFPEIAKQLSLPNKYYFDAVIGIIGFVTLGKYFEAKSTMQASLAMRKLMELNVKKARILIDGQYVEIDIENVKLGDTLLVRPSEKIPLDGEIIEGSSLINEAMLTGESMPVEKTLGARVFGATINESGLLKIKVTKIGNDTALAQIIQTVKDAQSSKAPIQRMADKISGIFVPVILAISVMAFVGWYLLTGSLSIAIINSVAVLVIACPCALGLATPLAIMVGTGRGAKRGILFKNGESFERIKKISMVVFDKTGTLTKGTPVVGKILLNPKAQMNEKDILEIAASLAINSEHPYSKAIVEYGRKKEAHKRQEISMFEEDKGKGVFGVDGEGKKLLMGNAKMLEAHNLLLDSWACVIEEDPEYDNGALVFVVRDNSILGAIYIFDELRSEAKATVDQLKKMNLKLAIVSGDRVSVATAVGKSLGIETVVASLLPHEKLAIIKQFQTDGEKVIFVGDGINDAPSLIAADLGVALGSAMDIAKEAGQILLLENNLEKVVEAIVISQKTFRTIWQNLFLAFVYNGLAIPLAVLGFLNPAMAAAAMSLSSISVVLNSLRLAK